MSQSSHPPSLLTIAKKTLLERCDLKKNAAIAVGVSGGADSMALLHCLILARASLGFSILAISVDHGLRAESAQEVELVRDFCSNREVPFEAVSLGLSKSANQQARARDARYKKLWEVAQLRLGADCYLATAHHKDDRAETVLLRMLRGTSLAGLGVLPPRQQQLLRPLIFASRADIELHIERHQIPFVTDPSNADPHYLRARVRHELLPLLKTLGPGVVEHLALLAEEATDLPEPLGLSREHRAQLRKAALDPRVAIDLRLPAGLRLFREPRQRPQ